MFRKALIFMFLLIFPFLSTFAYSLEFVYGDFGNKIYFLEVAQDAQSRAQGLSGRAAMERNEGMLFVFKKAGNYTFAMREMKFPLDFVWVRDGIVIDLTANVPAPNMPADNCKALFSSQPCDKVIELNAGEIRNSSIKVGDTIRFYTSPPES
jgi:uncharacterized membrane protein (UPF0127 family)